MVLTIGLTSQTHLVSYDNGLLCFLLDFVALFATNESLTEGFGGYEAKWTLGCRGSHRPQKRSKTKKKTAIASADEIDLDMLKQMAKDARYRPSPVHTINPILRLGVYPDHHSVVPTRPSARGQVSLVVETLPSCLDWVYVWEWSVDMNAETGPGTYGRSTPKATYTRRNCLIAALVNITGIL